jgi:hypothetical protein
MTVEVGFARQLAGLRGLFDHAVDAVSAAAILPQALAQARDGRTAIGRAAAPMMRRAIDTLLAFLRYGFGGVVRLSR